MKSKLLAGFNLIEIIFAVLILAFLASSMFIPFKNVLIKSKDVQKLDDVKTLQSALDLYKFNEGFYPATSTVIAGQPLTSLNNTKTYLNKIPSPVSDSNDDDYQYYQLQQGGSYRIDYKIENRTGNISPGKCSATPSSVCKLEI
ncbi:MAG: type II secretion system protein GspG [Patescibacteria group bacterium]|nr:type II secretion system protein GspG [Patescibacteria group bacterium]